MQVQRVQFYNYNHARGQYVPKSVSAPNFGSNTGQDFITWASDENNGASNVSDFLKRLSSFGVVSKDELKGILEDVVDLKSTCDSKDAEQKEREENLDKFLTNIETIKPKVSKNLAILYNSKDVSDQSEYETFGEQLFVLSQIFNRLESRFTNITQTALADIAKAMRNNEGKISSDMMKFFETIANEKNNTDITLVPIVMEIVKDENGNLDMDKRDAFLANYGFRDADLLSTIEVMLESYTYDKSCPKFKEIENAVAKYKDHDKLMKLMNYLNKFKNSDGSREFNIVLDDDGLLCIVVYGGFDAGEYGCDNNWFFKHVKEFIFYDRDYTLSPGKATSLGALRRVYGKIDNPNDRLDLSKIKYEKG